MVSYILVPAERHFEMNTASPVGILFSLIYSQF